MAKKVTTTKSAAPKIVPDAPVKLRNKEKVLVLKTATELKDLIGADTPIGVSRKTLKAIVLKQREAEVLSDLGI